MKLMQETTSRNLLHKFESDMQVLAQMFENKLSHQKMIHNAFEKKYTITVMDRILGIEN